MAHENITAWRWLKAELLTRLGEEAMAEVWRGDNAILKKNQIDATITHSQRALREIEAQMARWASLTDETSHTFLRRRNEAAHINLTRAQAKRERLEAAVADVSEVVR